MNSPIDSEHAALHGSLAMSPESRAKTIAYILLLAAAAIYAAMSTYFILSESSSSASDREILGLLFINLGLAAALVGLISWRIWRLVVRRRRGRAGAQLHVRLVAMFGVAAAIPVIVMAAFSWATLKSGLEQWFGDRTERAVTSVRTLATGYVEERARELQQAILLTAADLNRVEPLFERSRILFNRYLSDQTGLRLFDALYLIDGQGAILAKIELSEGAYDLPPESSFRAADAGDVVIGFNTPEFNEETELVRATYKLGAYNDGYIVAYRLLSPAIIEQLRQSKRISDEYRAAEARRAQLEMAFTSGYAALALVILFGAIWLGIWAAASIVSPIGRLVGAAGQVSDGDLSARVAVSERDGELGVLGRAFNRMTAQLQAQRDDLIEANRQFDERRRFTETVLAGVSAGVIGLTSEGRVTIANTSARALLDLGDRDLIGEPLSEIAPEFASIVAEAVARPDDLTERQIDIERRSQTRNLNVRVTGDASGDANRGFVVTFDDITNLVSAQRTAAWGDVARRIAHEIKNPLTPIQLSAERLRRKYADEVKSNPDVFRQCTETIIRQVLDIGRMVDEFSSFARMPAAVMADEDLCELARAALFSQRVANPDIEFIVEIPADPVMVRCDGRLVVQALTNILKNAAEAVDARCADSSRDDHEQKGRLRFSLREEGDSVIIEVADNGIGLPRSSRHRLTEPYMTTRAKGTGLGLAIVKKVMEEHGGALSLEDTTDLGARGALVRLTFPKVKASSEAPAAANDAEGEGELAAAELEKSV